MQVKEPRINHRSGVLMFEEQDQHFHVSGSSIDEFLTDRCNVLVNKYGLEEYAFIHHDADQRGGGPVEPHYHLSMYFGKRRPMVSSIAEALQTTDNQIEIMTKRGTPVQTARVNAFMYLIHATRNARREGKHQYPPEKVTANFDYPKFARGHILQDTPEDILEDLAIGKVTRTEANSRMIALGAVVLAKNKRKLDEVADAALTVRNERWRRNQEKQHSQLLVLWFCGETGTGKTRYAKHLAREVFKLPFFVAGAHRDAMQDYEGQHMIIWDELRKSDIEYSELLRLLDPFNYDKTVSSRYYNKNLMPEVMVITSPYSPEELYQVMNIADRKIDKVDQLARRVPLYYEFHQDRIKVFRWNKVTHEYWCLDGDVLPPIEEDVNKHESAVPFYGLNYYQEYSEIDPLTNEPKEKPSYDSPKLRNGAHDSNSLSGSLSHLCRGNDND